ncbi:MAG: cation:proton antiporter [Rickettsia endosymbiont of Ixodes persulcatus]|nr:cation:proton antiporter [Rickettsia endosymbiont of Ixodes persulcatus]MCZ6925997.1 cation:proton antiporter [Rickettsia endosymbiont of Ixodes persulcatus]
MQTVVITRAKVVKRKDIIESKAPNKGSNICMIGKWLARIMELYSKLILYSYVIPTFAGMT